MVADVGRVRDVLVATQQATLERRRLLGADLASVIEGSTDVATDDEHDPEGATIAYERSRLLTLITQADDQLVDVQAGLDRLAAGSYGRCERCGDQIAAARLEALPATRTCLRCAAASTGR